MKRKPIQIPSNWGMIHSISICLSNNIGKILKMQGRHKEALEYLNKSLEINRKVFGSNEHLCFAETFQNIKSVSIIQGIYQTCCHII
jgi:tetratricopeptide (TPR) repeat protein